MDSAELHVSASDYGRDNHIFITHGHYDHAGSAELLAGNGNTRIYCTASPAGYLASRLADASGLIVVRPGDSVEVGDAAVTLHPGRHIRYDGRLIRRTVFSSRNLKYHKNFRLLVGGHRSYRENGETVVYEAAAEGKTVVVLGSLALCEGHTYPKGPDLLTLPYQGTSDLITPALRILEAIRPKAVLLNHFDDAFPPLSRAIDTTGFTNAMDRLYPDVRVIKPEPRQRIEI